MAALQSNGLLVGRTKTFQEINVNFLAVESHVFHLDMPPGWVPTLELTVHVRAVPAPGPVKCVFRSHFVQGGFFNEDGEVWDSAGTLVAQSRQLGLTPLA